MLEVNCTPTAKCEVIDCPSDRIQSYINLMKNQKNCVFIIDNDQMLWCHVENYSQLKKSINGKEIPNLNYESICNCYKKNRILIWVKLKDKNPVLIDDANAVNSCIIELKKSCTEIWRFNIFTQTPNSECIDSFQSDRGRKRISQNDNDTKAVEHEIDKSLSPRVEHSTKVALTPHESILVIRAFPNDRNNSNNGLRRTFDDIGNGWQSHEKLSIPVTDGSGPASHEVATNGLSRYKSIIINNAVDSDGGASRSSHSYSSYTPIISSHSNSQVPVSRQGFAPSTGNYTTTNPPRHPDYANFNHRKLSFGSWPLSGKPDPTTLANWGFFATGAQDLVRCYYCGIGLKDWISDDDVMTEHIKHSCDCPFLLRELGQERLQRLKIAVLYPETINQNTTSPTPSPQVTLPYKIRHPRYQTMEARISSYDKFPSHVSQTPIQCAVAGFFFTGEKDICRCFTCDGGLQRWDPEDDPIIEHSKYFPTCDYIKQLKGDNYIQQIQMEFKASQQQGATGGLSDQINGMKSTTTDDISFKMNDMSFKATSTNDTSTHKDNLELLRTDVAKPALDMGYSKKDVSRAIEKMRKEGQTSYTADELVNFLLDNMDNVQSYGNASEFNKNANRNTTDNEYLVEENERLKSLTKCMLCLTGETNILCLPCTHHKTCQECSKTLTHCPVCGRIIREKIRTYMA